MTFFLSQTCRYHLTVANTDSTGSEQVAHATGHLTGLPHCDVLLFPASSTTGQNILFEAQGLGSCSGDGAEILPVAGFIPVGSRGILPQVFLTLGLAVSRRPGTGVEHRQVSLLLLLSRPDVADRPKIITNQLMQ